ncbi:hypothetical protein QW71_12970 [Paenibacillus sp. IHB B 3415]|uniref:hypothetical protein n=1 Tax=Paenibacillus sp. IHB B 3415 TaxID=867080 RepID=UPI000573AF3F|nr:hypothetical protein [Paenibacillus sp. IHB B 3415]KHL95370.1 hypothetical protein QW71_12970 [Paenibacillus sp. IHB B 3415]
MVSLNLSSINQNEPDLKILVNQLLNAYNKLTKELLFVLNNLDTRNINEIHAEKLVALSIETEKLAAGAVTADKITVGELSAISADLGHITAGLIESIKIFGSYIATRDGTFPRCEMSNTGNVFAAYTNAGNKIAIDPNYAGVPSLDFYMNGTIKGKMDTIASIMEMVGNGGLLLYSNGGNLELNASSGFVSVPTWYKLLNDNTDRTLGEELSEIYDRLEALEGGA